MVVSPARDPPGYTPSAPPPNPRIAVTVDKMAKVELREGREIIGRLSQQSPDNATLPNDLAWFDEQIAALAE
jgi:hypothetical protein